MAFLPVISRRLLLGLRPSVLTRLRFFISVAGGLEHWRHFVGSWWSLWWWASTYVPILYWTGVFVVLGRHRTRRAFSGTIRSQRCTSCRALTLSAALGWVLWISSAVRRAGALLRRSSWRGLDRERRRVWWYLRALWRQTCCRSLPRTFYRACRTLFPTHCPSLPSGPSPRFSGVRLHSRVLCRGSPKIGQVMLIAESPDGVPYMQSMGHTVPCGSDVPECNENVMVRGLSILLLSKTARIRFL